VGSDVFSLEKKSLMAESIDMILLNKVQGDFSKAKADGSIGFAPRQKEKVLKNGRIKKGMLPFVT
jgi:hypothetical protein